MPALEPLRGLHVVADPGALDAARWTADLPPTGSARPPADLEASARTPPARSPAETPPADPRAGALPSALAAEMPSADVGLPGTDRPPPDRVTDAPVTVLRFAPDEALAIGAGDVEVTDPHAIVVDDHGFVGAWCTRADLGHHIEWAVPDVGPVLAQGAIAGVPAKLWIARDRERILLVAAAPYAHELAERLGWVR